MHTSSACASQIRRVLRKKSRHIQYCYAKRLKAVPSLAGRVDISLLIGADGTTSDIKITNTTTDKGLTSCLQQKVKLWGFPTNCSTTLTFPFVLTSSK